MPLIFSKPIARHSAGTLLSTLRSLPLNRRFFRRVLTTSGVAVLLASTLLTIPDARAQGARSGKPQLVSFSLPPDLGALSTPQIAKLTHEAPAALGSLSLGFPHNGKLLNPVQPQAGPLFEVVAPDFCYGTVETVNYLTTAVREVQRTHPGTLPLHIGHISKPGGGYLSPHLSHQSGRDVDLGYYYKAKRTWYRRATGDTLDVERTWTLVRALITETDVEFLFIDRWVQILLKNYAKKVGEDEGWLHQVFVGSADRPAVIRHEPGHATHIHARFYNPLAQENARLAYPHLLSENIIEPVVVYLEHRVRKGETLGRLAKRYGTTVQAIQQANGLRGTTIQAKRTYKIPRRGGPAPITEPFELPPRLLPPTKES